MTAQTPGCGSNTNARKRREENERLAACAETPETTGPREGLTVPAHHLIGLDLGFKCTNCGGHTSVTPPCIPARIYPHPAPTPDPAEVTPEDVEALAVVTLHERSIGLVWSCSCGATGAGYLPRVREAAEEHQRGHYAALIEQARAEGKAEGLREAAALVHEAPALKLEELALARWLRSRIPATDSTALDGVRAQAWERGYASGHSNAMRRMSDEPSAPTTPNPFRIARLADGGDE